MDHGRLFRGAPDAIAITGRVDFSGRWVLRAVVRRSGESWDEADVELFDHLTTDELLDAAEASLFRSLAL